MQKHFLNWGTTQVLLFNLTLFSSSGQDSSSRPWGEVLTKQKSTVSSQVSGDMTVTQQVRPGKETKGPLPPPSHSPQTRPCQFKARLHEGKWDSTLMPHKGTSTVSQGSLSPAPTTSQSSSKARTQTLEQKPPPTRSTAYKCNYQ